MHFSSCQISFVDGFFFASSFSHGLFGRDPGIKYWCSFQNFPYPFELPYLIPLFFFQDYLEAAMPIGKLLRLQKALQTVGASGNAGIIACRQKD